MNTNKMRRAELLCPAGDMERLEAALSYGADAVYLGREQFSMRAGAANFRSREDFFAAAALVHAQGRRLYLTCNTLPHGEELAAFPAFIADAQAAGVDALILADIGLLMWVHELAPELEIHMSTQTGIVNAKTCEALWRLGVRRAVLARELSLEEIAALRREIPAEMELEAFVHGAMCMSFSGRCMLSAYMTGRDANRGACAQPCRWKYALVEEKRPGQYFPVEEDRDGTYIFNAKDLCMIGHLPALLEAGVDSLKIEGRNKSAYYVAAVTNAYRAALDAAQAGKPCPAWALREVFQVSHRAYCTGFYFGREQAQQRYDSSSYVRNCDVAAVVEKTEGDRLYLTQRNRFYSGEMLSAIAPGQPPVEFPAADLRDENDQPIEAARHAMMPCSIQMPPIPPLPAGAFLRVGGKAPLKRGFPPEPPLSPN